MGVNMCRERSVDDGMKFAHGENFLRDRQRYPLWALRLITQARQREELVLRCGVEIFHKAGTAIRVSAAKRDAHRRLIKADGTFDDIDAVCGEVFFLDILDNGKGCLEGSDATSHCESLIPKIKCNIVLVKFLSQLCEVCGDEETDETSRERDRTNLPSFQFGKFGQQFTANTLALLGGAEEGEHASGVVFLDGDSGVLALELSDECCTRSLVEEYVPRDSVRLPQNLTVAYFLKLGLELAEYLEIFGRELDADGRRWRYTRWAISN